MFPNIAQVEETLLIKDLRGEAANDFHLNYEEHLKPFIYGTIDKIDKEIVESHVETCAVCREDLRDLLNFHQELEREKEIRELSKTSWWTTLADWFSELNQKPVWLAFAAILIFVGAGLTWFFLSKPTNEIVQNRSNTEKIEKIENTQTVREVNSSQPVNNANQTSNVPKVNAKVLNQNVVLPEKEVEMASLVLPKILNDLQIKETEIVRGNDDFLMQKITAISPNGAIIRDSSPVLSWKSVANVQTFEVAVFDNDLNLVAKNDSVNGNSWRVANLTKGKVYQWQVTAKSVATDGKTTRFPGQGKFYVVSQTAENLINQAKTSLEKGKAFAEAGLLREAASEFRKYLKENPNSKNAKKFLRQVEQAQR